MVRILLKNKFQEFNFGVELRLIDGENKNTDK